MKPSTNDTRARRGAATSGRTRPSGSTQGDAAGAQPRLPAEHDESADSQAGATASSTAVGRQGLRDIERGLVDTGTAPVTDRTYSRVKGRGESGEAAAPRRTRKAQED